jgi:hypothetical protein
MGRRHDRCCARSIAAVAAPLLGYAQRGDRAYGMVRDVPNWLDRRMWQELRPCQTFLVTKR